MVYRLAATDALADSRRAMAGAAGWLAVPASVEGFSPRAAWPAVEARTSALAIIRWVRVRSMGSDSIKFWLIRTGEVVNKFHWTGVV
jgi:hypothetical protein